MFQFLNFLWVPFLLSLTVAIILEQVLQRTPRAERWVLPVKAWRVSAWQYNIWLNLAWFVCYFALDFMFHRSMVNVTPLDGGSISWSS